MKRLLATTAVTGLLLIGAAPAYAASGSQRECEASGGEFSRVGNQVSCTYPVVSDPVGNSENSNGKSQTVDTQTTETSQGTLNNRPKHRQTTTCEGPGNGKSKAGC